MYKKLYTIIISMLLLFSAYSIQTMDYGAMSDDEESIITFNNERIPLTSTRNTNNTTCSASSWCTCFHARNLYATLASVLLVSSVIELMTFGHSSNAAYNAYLGVRGTLAFIALIKDARERYVE